MYNRSAIIYDAIYRAQGKDYLAEAEKLRALIKQCKRSDGKSLLDVACGTGNHLAYLQENFDVEGLDNSKEMLDIAQNKFPNLNFHLADMADFEIAHSFDVIACLFSAIGYAQTFPRLTQTIKTIARHLRPGGVAIIEPWFGPGDLDTGKVHATFVDEPELKIARMNINRVEGNISFLDFHYMVATPKGVEYFTETHALWLFTPDQYQKAFEEAELKLIRDEEGLDGRGLYIGLKSNSQSSRH
ncbi:MAG: class I SAM-dependent methyltransferase [Chloroflexi bacterium]|nr:class I SAM-dependent methyltransferase [Chloroflexota bacterium]MBI1854679.1 class I SAM-dependent methyltransferase [Chloroflexota bacterium]MBI3339064.1 class I SAM-dependent methyltransferase [Chloroflexota bacterium]